MPKVLRLREMILSGELPGGSRIAELNLVQKLGLSRTPIRGALQRLEQEGLLQALPNRGYAVRVFSEREIGEAIELRGMVEGFAARLAAERGAPPVVLNEARVVLHRPQAVMARTIPPSAATLEAIDETSCLMRCGAGQLDSLDSLAYWLMAMDVDFDVLEPPALLERMRAAGERLARNLARTST